MNRAYLTLLIIACGPPNRTVLGGGYPSESKLESTPWVLAASDGPPATEFAAMAYDADREQVVLFALGETWLWNGAKWARATPATSPASRSHHLMTYDPRRGRVLMIGGTSFTDTWEWDGTTWSDVTGAASFAASLDGAQLYYDSSRGSPLLVSADHTSSFGSHQWVRKDETWQELAEKGPQHDLYAAAFDPIRNVSVSVGLGGSFEDDGKGWVRVAQEPTLANQMVFDPTRRRMVMLTEVAPTLTREWSDGAWRLTVSNPGEIYGGSIVYDAARGQVVFFSASAVTWVR